MNHFMVTVKLILVATIAFAVTTLLIDSVRADPAPAWGVEEVRTSAKKPKYVKIRQQIGERKIAKYRLRNRHIKEIKKAKKFAKTRKARSVRRCESGGNYRINTGNGYYGAYQFNRGTWLSNGGGRYAAYAHKAPKFAQDHIAYKTWKARGWQPWACA